jgi:hypothetical protein
VEHWLNKQNGCHDSGIPHIKLFWLYVFNKKRPLIPNLLFHLNMMMEALSKNTGVAVVWNCNAKAFIQDKKMKKIWDSKQMPRKFYYR